MREHGVVLCGHLPAEQCDSLIAWANTVPPLSGKVNTDDGARLSAMREVDVWPCDLPRQDIINLYIEGNKTLQYDVTGLEETPQLLRYPAGSAGYDWHTDLGYGEAAKRKLSIVIGINDQYEGGDLEFFVNGVQSIRLTKGMVVAFPSWMSHRVTPVTAGVRWTIAAWISGPELR